MAETVQDIVDGIGRYDDGALVDLIERYRIRAASEYAEKDYLLERDGVGFSPRGNVMALTAEKKAGKSWFGMSMCAALLAGQFLGMRSRNTDARVLFFDTEQDESDGQRIQRRVHCVCGWKFDEDDDRFQIFHLRELKSEDRRRFVVQTIEFLKPDFVVVDGVRDLLQDFNDIEQSAALVGDLMRLSSEQKCAIWAVLHVNPNSEKMRGHLGTELGNKVADILYMTKQKSAGNEDDVTYTMEEVAARSHRDIHSIKFRIDDNAPYGLPVLLGESDLQEMDDREREVIDAKMRLYVPSPGSISTTKLLEAIKAGEKIGTTKAYRLITQATVLGVIERASNGKLMYVGLKKAPELPFDEPTDEKVPY